MWCNVYFQRMFNEEDEEDEKDELSPNYQEELFDDMADQDEEDDRED